MGDRDIDVVRGMTQGGEGIQQELIAQRKQEWLEDVVMTDEERERRAEETRQFEARRAGMQTFFELDPRRELLGDLDGPPQYDDEQQVWVQRCTYGQLMAPESAAELEPAPSGGVRPKHHGQWHEPVAEVQADALYAADITLACVRCFGTEDPGGLFKEAADEIYVVAVAPDIRGTFRSDGRAIQTWRSETVQDVKPKRLILTERVIAQDVPITAHGLWISIAIYDEESGGPAEAAAVVGEVVSALDHDFTMTAGDAKAQVEKYKTVELLGKKALEKVAEELTDDLIETKTWKVDGSWLMDWLRGVRNMPDFRGETEGIQANFPYDNPFGQRWLFSGGGGSYKVYLDIAPKQLGPPIYRI
ncbi:hypothetical protein [Micromonospora sp. NPDC047134]|uniref:hypothetical protein n=1 Tax=Micromonospora sp. NPDC047134 TaxID=3154340 RepID=UPI00340067AD